MVVRPILGQRYSVVRGPGWQNHHNRCHSSLVRDDGFSVTNLSLRATKTIKVTDSFSIPIYGQLTGNPCSQKAYLVFGFLLQP
ncbi:MAG: hypothetical protein J6I61_05990 [Prevotella sp.]|nr:hypothetical protein [Prevotella sp.]